MPNHANDGPPGGPHTLESLTARLADPRVVLLAVGLLGLALDLFVRPISWVGLALILLATTPWILQAWSQRPSRGATRAPVSRLPGDSSAPAGKAPRAQQQPAAPETIRRAPPTEPAQRASAAVPPAGPERRPAAQHPPQAGIDRARTG
jgi:hypothetical protein